MPRCAARRPAAACCAALTVSARSCWSNLGLGSEVFLTYVQKAK